MELSSSIANLKCLKYLDISSVLNGSCKLPNYITKLYNLQTLRVCALQELPEKFCNLINLRHILIEKKYVHNNPRRRCMLIGIERLTCLQTLPHFVVSKDQSCLAEQLGGLKDLRGKLELYGLSEIENMEEARKADLCAKSYIECLELFWSNDNNMNCKTRYNDEGVIEVLEPHRNLKQLTIVYFKGKKLTSWITMMTNLVKITLRDCKGCEGFPPLGHLPKLKGMEIIRMDSLVVIEGDSCGGLGSNRNELNDSEGAKPVTTMYPSLTKLIMWDLPNLEEWLEPVMSIGCEDRILCLHFPNLRCWKLVVVQS